jgi:hypothetical protein
LNPAGRQVDFAEIRLAELSGPFVHLAINNDQSLRECLGVMGVLGHHFECRDPSIASLQLSGDGETHEADSGCGDERNTPRSGREPFDPSLCVDSIVHEITGFAARNPRFRQGAKYFDALAPASPDDSNRPARIDTIRPISIIRQTI